MPAEDKEEFSNVPLDEAMADAAPETWDHPTSPTGPAPVENNKTLVSAKESMASPSMHDGIPFTGGQILVLYFGIFSPCVAFIAVYSAMGKGLSVYSSLSREGNYSIAWYLAMASLVWLSFLWLIDAFDKSLSSNAHKRLVMVLTLIPACMIFIASLLAVEHYVSAPMVLFVIFKAVMGKMMRDYICPYNALSKYMLQIAYGNFLASLACIAAWVIWMLAYDSEWNNSEMFDIYHQKLDCNRATDSLEVGRCQAAYLLWGSPLIIGGLCFFFACACVYLAKEGSAMRMLVVQVLILGMGLWVSMSISGAEMGLADDLLQFGLLFCTMFVVVCINMIGVENIRSQMKSIKITAKLGEYSQSDFAKSLLIVLMMPIMPFLLALSIATRKARIVGFSLCPHLEKLDRDYKWFTASTWNMGREHEHEHEHVSMNRTPYHVFKWLFSNTTAVLTNAAYVGIFYFVCDVGVGKGATLFLGWMISVMKELHPAVVIVAFIGLGVCMFLLPPVPGPPVYLTGGVLVVGALEESMGFWPACAICVLVCWVTKLMSCALQQKMFGESMSGIVGVRYAVGINSLQMRAIRYCLMQKGLNPAKIAILCGGPDWPTSVLCGILRVPLHEAMIGTSPVLVLYLGYTVLAGAFTLKTGGSCDTATLDDATAAAAALGVFPPSPPPLSPSPPPAPQVETGNTNYWQMGGAVALGVAMISMTCTSFAAVYFMEDTIENKRKECDAFPVDEEVEARERKVQAKQTAYKEVTKWTNLPDSSRYLLGGAVLCMTGACHMAGNFGAYCFSTFTVTCTVALVDVVKPLGWVAIGLFFVGFALFQVYLVGASKRTEAVMSSNSMDDVPAPSSPAASPAALPAAAQGTDSPSA